MQPFDYGINLPLFVGIWICLWLHNLPSFGIPIALSLGPEAQFFLYEKESHTMCPVKNIQQFKNTEKSIMIIGGGVAGLSAAGILGRYNLAVHLVEKTDQLGGNAASWACMATQACQNCGACLVPEMVQQAKNQDNLTTHLNRTVTNIMAEDGKYRVSLDPDMDSPLFVDKIIMATGFSPISPDGLMGEKYHAFDRVITTVDLNKILAGQGLGPYLGETAVPRIGFIQCVGSRNRLKGRDYCSQVCCKVSLRHINKLLSVYPKADISMFYMDLQIMGKETRSAFETLGKNIRLVQGVPLDIMNTKKEGMLTIIREDYASGSRIAEHFDLIVLSVGIAPGSALVRTAPGLHLNADPWGFLLNPTDSGIHIAGCAAGPRDILTSKADGESAARSILKECGFMPSPQQRTVAVFGDGKEALKIAEALRDNGHNALILGKGESDSFPDPKSGLGILWKPFDTLLSVKGTVNRFELVVRPDRGPLETHEVCAVIVAEPVKKQTAFTVENPAWDCLFSIARFEQILDHTPDKIPDRVLFHLGTYPSPPKQEARMALDLALRLVKAGKKADIIIRHMAVHGKTGQNTYDEARKLGVKFFRVTDKEDVTIGRSAQGLTVSIKDAFLFDISLRFNAGWIVVPENATPSPGYKKTMDLLKLESDCEGFFQSPNIRHRLTGSPRKGIFFAGACHDDTDAEDLSREIQTILSSIETLEQRDPGLLTDDTVVIDEYRCVRCLTCYRICPHCAIVIVNGIKPYVVPEACVSCGLCVSSCPALAITQTDFHDPSISNETLGGRDIIFACERSAAIAAKSTTLPENTSLITVPCVCRVDTGTLLKTWLNGASSITLAGCHPGNCRSSHGSRTAVSRTQKTNRLLEKTGAKVEFKPFAANEPVRFQDALFPGK